jgi:hypothetical protein
LLIFKPIVTSIKKNFIFSSVGDIFSLDWELNVPYRYKKKYCDDLIELEFEGFNFYAPKDYKLVLKDLYGDFMTPPPNNQRTFRHHNKIIFH